MNIYIYTACVWLGAQTVLLSLEFGSPGFIVKHLYVTFGLPIAATFLRYRAEKQTDTPMNGGENRTPAAPRRG